MKKIMFSERFGLDQAVLAGTKTMTRRIIKCKLKPQYEIGERVAIAQPYKNDDVLTYNAYNKDGTARKDGLQRHKEMLDSKGYRNKMFVKAEYMPHSIRITGIKVDRLQEISEEECLKEGIYPFKDGDYNGFSFDGWMSERVKGKKCYSVDARFAFECLIDKMYGKGTWERNPWVFVYTFELLK
jgi:hypothetical protein